MDNFQEGQHQIANALDNCKSDLERALALSLIYELGNYYYIYGEELRHGYGNQYGEDISALQNNMQDIMSMCSSNSVYNTTVTDIYLGFNKIVNAHLANFYNNRSKNGQ